MQSSDAQLSLNCKHSSVYNIKESANFTLKVKSIHFGGKVQSQYAQQFMTINICCPALFFIGRFLDYNVMFSEG